MNMQLIPIQKEEVSPILGLGATTLAFYNRAQNMCLFLQFSPSKSKLIQPHYYSTVWIAYRYQQKEDPIAITHTDIFYKIGRWNPETQKFYAINVYNFLGPQSRYQEWLYTISWILGCYLAKPVVIFSDMQVYRTNQCIKCGHILEDADSIVKGLGRCCISKSKIKKLTQGLLFPALR